MKTVLLFFFWLTSFSAIAENITVQNGNDAGSGSLRQAIADAKNGDVISFNKPITVLLTSGQLVIDKSIRVEGKGSTIKGSFTPLIKAETGKTILLKNFFFWEDSPKPGGAILNLTRNLKLENCSLITNKEAPGGKKPVAIKIAHSKIAGLLSPQKGGDVLPSFTNPGDGDPGDCTILPDAPDISVTQPACGSNTGSLTINSPVGSNIQYSIATVGQVGITLTTNTTFNLDAGNSYIIYSLFINTSCRSAEATVVTISSSTPIINVVPPSCGGSTGTAAVTSPAGADYEYSSNGGASYQASPTFTVAASTPYSITVQQISTGCVSIAATGTMATSNSIVYVNANAGGLNNGTSWANAYNKLQDALANVSGCVNQVWVAKGTYYPDEGGGQTDNERGAAFVMAKNLAIYGGFAGTETQLSQRNWKTNVTILSGDIDKNDGPAFANNTGNSYHVVYFNGLNSLDNTAILDGFTVSGGNANAVVPDGYPRLEDQSNEPQVGGGMITFDGSPAVANCTFSGNSASAKGGGFYNLDGAPSVTNCIFSGNHSDGAGGGLYCYNAGTLVVNCSIANNSASSGGGGIYFKGYSSFSPNVINCSFSGNTAGGLFVDNTALPVTNCIFWGNSSEIETYVQDAEPIVTYSIVKGGYTGTGNLNVDPLFVNAASGDLHLQPTSPAVDAGNDAANNQTTDLDGNNRKYDAIPGGALIDMGAFESQQLVPQHTTTTVSTSNPACPGSGLFIGFSVFTSGGDVTTGNVIIKDNGIQIFEVSANKGFASPVMINTPGDHLIEADYEGAPGYAPSKSTTEIQKIFDLPTVDFSGLPQSICANAAPITLNGSPTGGTFSGPGISGTSFDPLVAGSGSKLISYTYADANGCSNKKSYSIMVNAANMVTITGNATVCLNSSPNPTVTFATSGGIAPYAFSYTVNDDPTVLTAFTLSGTATVEVPTSATGSFTYKLAGVVDNFIGTCFQIAANPSVTVIVNPLPSADIGTGSSVCKDGNASINFAGSGGTPLYTFTYTIFDGSTTSAPLIITSDKIPLSVPTGTPGNYTYNLINVADASTAGCSQSISGKSATITVNPLPDAAITTASPVTAASSGNVASVADAGTGAIYSWTILNGTIIAGTGTRSITYKAGNSGSVQLSVSVTGGSACNPVSGGPVSVPITALPCPNPAISVASSVCSASTGNKASVANAGAGAKYVWSITNGTITGGAGTNQITFTVATNKHADYDADDYVNLSVTVTNASDVCTELSGTYKRFISPIPSATISTASTVCSLSGNNFASVPFAGTGAKYTWTITNGNITWGAGTRSIAYTANASGSVVLTVTVTNYNGCSAASGNKTITIVALPVANITAAASICGGSGSNTASVTKGGTGTKYCWNISNGCINSGSSTSTISYTAGSSGSVTLSVTVTNSSGCKTTPGKKVVTIIAVPNATIAASSVVCSGSTGNSASVPGAGAGASYSWTISGGTISAGAGTSSIKYSAVASGYVTLGITVTNSNGCKKSASKKITIAANVTPTFAQIGPVCKGSKTPSLPAKSANGITGNWSPSAISTASLTTTTYTFTPVAGQCASSATMKITIKNCTTLSGANIVSGEQTISKAAPAMDVVVLPNPSQNFFTLVIKGNRKEVAEIRVVDIQGRRLDHFKVTTGGSIQFGGNYAHGTYVVQVIQGTEQKQLKLIKLSD